MGKIKSDYYSKEYKEKINQVAELKPENIKQNPINYAFTFKEMKYLKTLDHWTINQLKAFKKLKRSLGRRKLGD